MPTLITVGDRVKLDKKNLVGIVRFVGEIEGKNDIYYGIELNEAKGKTDGSIGSTQYFKCKAKRGIFVKHSNIMQINSKNNKNAPRVTVGDTVQCTKEQCKGIIKFIGTPFSVQKSGIVYGIILTHPNGDNNGTLRNRSYFKCKYKHGVFLDASRFTLLQNTQTFDKLYKPEIQKTKQHRSSLPFFKRRFPKKKDPTRATRLSTPIVATSISNGTISNGAVVDKPRILQFHPRPLVSIDPVLSPLPRVTTVEDRVMLQKSNLIGVVKFIGEIEGKSDIYYGVDLDEPKGKTDGYIGRAWYFDCRAKHGVFVKASGINKTNSKHNKKPRVTVGDTVHCTKQQSDGIIRFIGNSFSARKSNVLYGIELSKPNGKCNGTLNGRRYFKCKNKYGVFLNSGGFNTLDNMQKEVHNTDNELIQLRRLLTTKDNELQHQQKMYIELEEMFNERQKENQKLKEKIMTMNEQKQKPKPPPIHIINTHDNDLLDVVNNDKHRDMFNDFINDVYDLCVDDYSHLISESGPRLDLNQSFEGRIKEQIINENVSTSALKFYEAMIESMHIHLFPLMDTNPSDIDMNTPLEIIKQKDEYNLYHDPPNIHRKSLPPIPLKSLPPKNKPLPQLLKNIESEPNPALLSKPISFFAPPAIEMTYQSPEISATRSKDNRQMPVLNLISFGRNANSLNVNQDKEPNNINKPRHSVGFSDVINIDEYEISISDDNSDSLYSEDEDEGTVFLTSPQPQKHYGSKSAGEILSAKDLSQLLLFGEEKNQLNDSDDYDDSDNTPSMDSQEEEEEEEKEEEKETLVLPKAQHRVRRNSDTIVWTPTTASANNDSVYMAALANPPKVFEDTPSTEENDVVHSLLNPYPDQAPDLSTVVENAFNDTNHRLPFDGKRSSIIIHDTPLNDDGSPQLRRRNSAPETPTTSGAAPALNTFVYERDMMPPPPPPPPTPPPPPPPSNNDNNVVGRRPSMSRAPPPAPPRQRTRTRGTSMVSLRSRTSSIPVQPLPVVPTPAKKNTGLLNAGLLNVVTRSASPSMNERVKHEANIQLVDKLLGFTSHSWNFNNDQVDVFEEQCSKVEYEKLVPPILDILYPTMLSSLALPASAKFTTYFAHVKYMLSTFISKEELKAQHEYVKKEEEKISRLKFNFTFKTTIRSAIHELVHKLKKKHEKFTKYIHKLRVNCFVLKVCGREEYLKIDEKNKNKTIIALSHIRNCIRRNDIYTMELVLLYDDNLNDYNEHNMRSRLSQSYDRYYRKKNSAQQQLKYENMGYNVITKTLVGSIAGSADYMKTNLDHLNHDIEKEYEWLQKKVGSINQEKDRRSGGSPSLSMSVSFIAKTEIDDVGIKWDGVTKDAVLLNEFEHPIEISVSSLLNIMLCPRFRVNNTYYTYVLRIELMFGLEVFQKCSWDITIPTTKVSNKISMPDGACSFSTDDVDLDYASLPREATWCFTLYGIKKDVAVEQEQIKQEKKKKKKEPKILGAFIARKRDRLKSPRLAPEPAPINNSHISTRSVAEDLEQMIANEPINDFYSTRPDTARSFNAETIEEKEEANKYISEPMAWCRLPMVDHRHCLRRGRHALKLWTVPVFEKVKGGPKIDPYTTGNWKKFGSMRDCNLKKKNELNSVTLIIDFPGKEYSFVVVAPIVNQRRPQYIRRKIKEYKKKGYSGAKVLNNIIQRDGILPMDERDKLLVYSNKEKLMRDPSTIPTFLRSVHWLDQESRMEAYDYLEKWNAPNNPEDMIELLRNEFADNRVRLYAINCLNQLDDYALNRCLLQLVQALKNEPHHSSFLARFLIVRAIRNPFQIGHYLFWHLKSEFHDNNLEFVERYGLLLREYLLHLPYYPFYTEKINLAQQLYDENQLINRLKFISLTIKNAKSKKKCSNKHLMNLLQNELMRLNIEIFDNKGKTKSVTLPLNPSYKVCRLQFDKCRFMQSAKIPLWLVFNSSDRYYSDTISVMFKCGDDLRQDILTLQLISIMDAFWLSSSIDLNMRTYEVIGTGYQIGMLELILNSKTLNEIGSFNNKSHLKFISHKTSTNQHLDLNMKKSNYARSVAGFSVATWCLGIGDRHPDNIMIHENGTLFHIDFGHFLGNFKRKDIGGFVKWKRERTPFVFTNAMKYCIEGSSKSKQKKAYTQFVKLLFNAFCEIRSRYKFFLNLLLLMVPSQIPELITESDVSYFREICRFDLNDTEAIASYVESTLKLCLSDKNKKFDDMLHKIHHL